MIDAIHEILKSHLAPVVDRCVHCATLTSNSTSVRQKDNVTIRGQQLSPIPPPASVKSRPPRRIAGVSVDNHRIQTSRFIVWWCNQHTSTDQTIPGILPDDFT